MTLQPSAHAAGAKARRTAGRVAHSDPIDKAARAGFVAKGLIYVLVGVLAIQVAQGESEEADQQGALREVAQQPLGEIVLWLMTGGFAGYALWRFYEAVAGHRDESAAGKRALKRIGSALNGLVYLALGVLALRTVTGGSSGSGQSTIAKVLDWPSGELIVAGAGVAIIVIAIALAVRGLRTDFERDLDSASMRPATFRAVRRLGQVGYVARGVVFALVGALIISAAADHEPGRADGLDAALKTVRDSSGGPVLLCAAAAGLICFGAYCIAEARYRRLDTPRSDGGPAQTG
jgi:hypothetical protein